LTGAQLKSSVPVSANINQINTGRDFPDLKIAGNMACLISVNSKKKPVKGYPAGYMDMAGCRTQHFSKKQTTNLN